MTLQEKHSRKSIFYLLLLAMAFVLLSVFHVPVEAEGHTHCFCAGYDGSESDHDGSQTWNEWTATDSLPGTSGYYYLANDVILTDSWVTPSDGVHLCLNGHVITGDIKTTAGVHRKSYLINVNGVLVICDCNSSNLSHKFSVDSTTHAYKLDDSGDKTITGGVIAGADNYIGYWDSDSISNYKVPGVVDKNGSQVVVDRYMCPSSSGYGGGGAFYMHGNGTNQYLSMYGGTVAGNSACDGGVLGGFHVKGTFYHVNFTDNSSKHEGGAFYMYNGDLTFNDCNFVGNTADVRGGACSYRNIEENNISFNHCTFTGNQAANAGAIYAYQPSITNCTFTNNTATNETGVGAVWSDSTLTLESTSITDNAGSGLQVNAGTVLALGSNNTIKDNKYATTDTDANIVLYNETDTTTKVTKRALIQCNDGKKNSNLGGISETPLNIGQFTKATATAAEQTDYLRSFSSDNNSFFVQLMDTADATNPYALMLTDGYTIKFKATIDEDTIIESEGTVTEFPDTIDRIEDISDIAKTVGKKGYEIESWNTKEDFSGTSYNSNELLRSIAIPENNELTLYAQLSDVREECKKVTYKVDGEEDEVEYYYADAPVTTPAAPEKDGYTFQYWLSNYEGKSYQPANIFFMPNTDITLTAVYTKKSYAVSYNTSDATEAAPATQSFAADEIVTVSEAKLTKTGYTFLYWEAEYTDAGEKKTAKYAPGSTFVMPESAVSLTAVWNPNDTVKTCTVTFETDKKVNEKIDSPLEVVAGSCITLPSGLTKDGAIFEGWLTNGRSKPYAGGSSYQVNEDVTFKAHFTEKHTVSLSYDTVGAIETTPETEYYVPGDKVTVSEAKFTKDANSFQYWEASYTEADTEKTAKYAPGSTFVMPDANVTLTAKWLEDEVKDMYTLTYDTDQANEAAPAEQSYAAGDIVKVSDIKLTKDGYRFLYWQYEYYEDDVKKTVKYASGSTFKMPEEDVTLTAQWADDTVKTYTVTFNENGAKQSVSPMMNVTKGTSITLPAGLNKDGYSFDGWTIDGKLYAAGSSYTVNENVTATATFTKISSQKYTVTYEANGGSEAPASASYQAGTVQKVGKAPTAKKGYAFTGYLNSSTGTIMKPGDLYTVKANTAFTAQWTVKVTESILPCKGFNGNKKIKLSWIKVKGAYAYEVYESHCDCSLSKKIKATTALSYVVKKLSNKKAYKYYVRAYKLVNGKKVYLATSPMVHVAMKGTNRTNVKSIKLSKKVYSLSVGKTAKIKATLTKIRPSKKFLKHTSLIRYYSLDEKIAKVDKNGTITGVKKGSTKIYVVAENGVYKTIKVTVK